MDDELETALNPKAYNTVDPEVRAYVYSLVSALGGTGADEDGKYLLGDDALACLKDIKKWLKLYDEKSNRLDVARCLAEANLVNGDLLEILAAWPEEATDDKLKSKISLACLELLVPLTWPIDKSEMQMTVNHHRHVPYLQLAQTEYKRRIIQHDALILRTATRIVLPSIALPQEERTSRDEGIIKLLLYFLRNVAMISAPPNLPIEGSEGEVSRSATIEAFHKQEVLALLLTIASNMGEDFNTQDTVILEVLFHLLKGVDVEKLFMDKEQMAASNSDELKSLLKKEANMHRSYARNAPTRHNRFGTMIWVKRDNARGMSAVSGQDVLTDAQNTLTKMDQSKKWNKPKQRSKDTDQSSDRFDLPIPLDSSATHHLRCFVEEFLDSSFNPLFSHIRRAIEREADRVLEAHTQQFFYLVSWFLEAERVRRRKKAEALKKSTGPASKITTDFEADSFALIASVLNQETFILLNRFMQDRLDMKSWRDVNAGTRALTQILLIVQEMTQSPVEEDQEIAENIQNRIFYEETTHDRIIAILRGYKDQGFGYLDCSTELAHVFLRMLERYSRENVDLQVRSRRRARKSKKAAARQRGDEANAEDDENASEMEEAVEAERVSRERKFDFTRFAAKFMNQACIDTFVAFTKYYKDLSSEQLKRAHRFFYRVAFKQELSVILFRLDIISLFYRMIKGPQGLDSGGSTYREWEELVRQLIKRLIKKMAQRPEMVVELLFSKIRSSVFYLENGYEEHRAEKKPRPPAPLEIRGTMTKEEQLGVAVAVLYDDNLELVDWIAKVLSDAASERQSWEAEAAARRAADDEEQPDAKPPSIVLIPGTPERATALFKNAKLRLLLTLAGFERLGIDDEPGTTWILPSGLTARDLHATHDCIDRHRRDPVMQYGDEDPVSAQDLLRRKPARRAEFDDDSDGIVPDEEEEEEEEEEFLFPAGGPVDEKRRKKDALAELKQKRRKRRHSDDEEEEENEATRERRRKARWEADLEKRRKIKSAEFVGDSSEEDSDADREFFRMEEERRRGQAGRVREALRAGRVRGGRERLNKAEKENEEEDAMSIDDGSATTQDEEEGVDEHRVQTRKRKSNHPLPEVRKKTKIALDDDLDSLSSPAPPAEEEEEVSTTDEAEDEETPLSSPLSSQLKVGGFGGVRGHSGLLSDAGGEEIGNGGGQVDGDEEGNGDGGGLVGGDRDEEGDEGMDGDKRVSHKARRRPVVLEDSD
ncbi:MAG: hypothetical protein Q9195_005772 [Heterodermia aff. obscurata]